jgi:hypothetical protein
MRAQDALIVAAGIHPDGQRLQFIRDDGFIPAGSTMATGASAAGLCCHICGNRVPGIATRNTEISVTTTGPLVLFVT